MSGRMGHPTPNIDYGHVSASINIGAAGTEISIFRGDILVFTRTIPNGGNSLTQALVDYLGLPFDAAERVKIEYGDALAAPQAHDDNAVAAPADDFEDWSDFGAAAEDAPSMVEGPDYSAPQSPSLEKIASTDAAAASDDPFDPDYFNQGDQSQAQQGFSDEPRQQHAQKENDPNADDSADPFDFDFDLPATDASTEPAASEPADTDPVSANQSHAQETTVGYGGDNDAPIFSFDDVPGPANDADASESATGESVVDDDFAFPDIDAPAATTEEPITEEPAAEAAAPAESAAPSDAAADSGFNFDLDDTPSSGGSSDFSFDFDAPPAASTETPVAAAESETATSVAETDSSTDMAIDAEAASLEPSAWNLGDLGMADDETATTSAVPGDPTPTLNLSKTPETGTPTAATPADDMDLDELFGAPDAQEQVTTGAATADSMDDFAALSGDFGGDATGFGGAIGEDAPGVDAETVYSILHPLLDGLASEVRRSLEFHASRYPSAVVQNIEIVGGGAKFKNIDVFLTQSLGIPSVVGNPLRVLSIPEKINRDVAADAPVYAVAVGLALRELLD